MKNFVKKFQKPVQPRRLKICIGIPCTGTVRAETLLSLIGILSATPHLIYVDIAEGCYIEQNRTKLVLTAQRENCDKLFFLDSDMKVEPQVINKLLALDKPIVGVAYNNRSPEISYENGQRIVGIYSNVKMSDENGKLIAVDPKHIPAVPFRAAAVPTGCMLVDMPTILKMPRPWFDLTWHEDGTLDLGEDVFFCRKAEEYGIETWCDPTIQIGHVGTFMY